MSLARTSEDAAVVQRRASSSRPPGSHSSGAKPPSCHAQTTKMPKPMAAIAASIATAAETGTANRGAVPACPSPLIGVASGSIRTLWLGTDGLWVLDSVTVRMRCAASSGLPSFARAARPRSCGTTNEYGRPPQPRRSPSRRAPRRSTCVGRAWLSRMWSTQLRDECSARKSRLDLLEVAVDRPRLRQLRRPGRPRPRHPLHTAPAPPPRSPAQATQARAVGRRA